MNEEDLNKLLEVLTEALTKALEVVDIRTLDFWSYDQIDITEHLKEN